MNRTAQAEPAPADKAPKKTGGKASREPVAEAAPQDVAPEGAPLDIVLTAPPPAAVPASGAKAQKRKKDRLNESLLYLLWVESFVFLLAAVTALINILVLTVSHTAEVTPTVSQNIFMASLYQSVARAVTTVLCPLFLINVAMAPASFFVLTGKGASGSPRASLGHLLNMVMALFLGAMAFLLFVVTDFQPERLRFLF